MLFYLIPGIIIVISIIIILIVIFRRFPELATVDLNSIQEEKELLVKEKIMAERLMRKFAIAGRGLSIVLSPFAVRVKKFFCRLWQKLIELEDYYRKKEKEIATTGKKPEDLSLIIDGIFSEAKRLVEEKKYEEAEKKYIDVLNLDKKNLIAYQGLARIYQEQKDFVHAKEILEHILKINSEDYQAYSTLGAIAKDQGNLIEAEKEYLKSLALNNQVADQYIKLGEVYQAMENTDRAKDSYVKALEIEPNNPRYLDILLEVSIISKDKELAKDIYQRLKKVNPENQKLLDFRKRMRAIKSPLK